jgi:hypothetical protein
MNHMKFTNFFACFVISHFLKKMSSGEFSL